MALNFLKADIKEVNWKRQLNTLVKVLFDFKTGGLIVLMGFTIYGIGWDTVVRPNVEILEAKDKAIQEQKKVLDEKGSLQQQYNTLAKQLESLDVTMIPIPSGNTGKVISVTESAELLRLAKGELRDEARLPVLQPPHDHRGNVALNPTSSEELDILKALGETPGAGAASIGEGNQAASSLPVERYDFELKATGTYAALTDLVNQLVLQKKLIRINKVTITKAPTPEPEPSPEDYPDYPVELSLVMSLSLYLYAADGSGA